LRHAKTGRQKSESGGERSTTNNRMELTAAIRGLQALKRTCTVELVTDSRYVADGLSQWIHGWKRNGWRRRDGNRWTEVKNADLWQELDRLASQHQVICRHILGHSGHPENEQCDRMAVAVYQQWC
jgi:ribonuclease HI